MKRAQMLLLVLTFAVLRSVSASPPETRLEPVVDTYFGHSISDPYRWLEDLRAPDVHDWFTAQNAYARSVLDTLPARAALRARLATLANTDVRVRNVQWGGEQLFYEKQVPGQDRYQVFVRTGTDGAERLLIDPARFDANGQPAAINFFVPAPNGKRLAFGVSLGGDEDATLHVIDVGSGSEIGAPVPRMDIGDPVSWRVDSRGLFYTQLNAPRPGQDAVEKYRSARVYFRDLGGRPDRAVFGRGVIAGLEVDPDDVVRVRSFLSSYAIAIVQHGNDSEMTLYAAPLAQLGLPRVEWRRITTFADGVTAFDVRGEWIYLQSHANAPRYRVLRWSLAQDAPLAIDGADVLVAQSDRVITGVSVARDALYVQQMDGGHDRLLRLEFNVKLAREARRAGNRSTRAGAGSLPKAAGIARASEIAMPFDGTIEERVADPMRAGVLLRLAGWTQAPAFYRSDPRDARLIRLALLPPSAVDFGAIASTQVTVRSHDGATVPVSIIYPRNLQRDGHAPLLLTAYGAYGISEQPVFRPTLLAWLERGGVFAVAHVRGGGEFGKAWHEAGRLANKPNTWLDLIAAADGLVRDGWTSPAHLAISGGSAGGIAVGGALTSRPELFRAVVSRVGVHDLLRSETTANGPSNIPEFGSVASEPGFRMLYAMSSYHQVKDGVRYPAMLLTTGFNDPRVDSWEPGKMAARLQAVNGGPGGSGRPVLLRVDFAGGHGIGATKAQAVEELADVYAFLLHELVGAP